MLRFTELVCIIQLTLIPWIYSQPQVAAAQGGAPTAAPLTSREWLASVETKEKLGWWYEARDTLRKAASSTRDPAVLRRYAEVEDTYGAGAPESYQMLAEALERSGPRPDYIQALDRGFQVSLREYDLEHARWFADRLERSGREGYLARLDSPPGRTGSFATIPGGTRALMFVVRGKEQGARNGFFGQYGRTLLDCFAAADTGAAEVTIRDIREHFKRVAALESLGFRKGSTVTITLSVRDEASRKTTEEVLSLLGWRMQVANRTLTLEPGEGTLAASRQLTATALQIDEQAMQEALQSDRPFTIEIVDESLPVLLGQDVWRGQFFSDQQPNGGFAEAMALNPVLAKVYAGLAALDDESAQVLVREIGLRQLAVKYADLLSRYATSLAVVDNRVMFPGGDRAAAIWISLTGSKDGSPGEFFRSLLHKDNGRLLVFYFTVAQLDRPHQEFLIRNLSRARKYYEIFRESSELRQGPVRALREAPFVEFFCRVPLDNGGRVRFPGGPGVWMAAGGSSENSAATEALQRTAPKTATPEEEDEILTRMMRMGYKTLFGRRSELEIFLAVASIESHRTRPLDERSALMLAQQYPRYSAAWPYFCMLTGLSADEFQSFFALGSRLRGIDGALLNDLLGQLHALIALLCRLQEAGKLSEAEAAGLFGVVCTRFSQASGAAELTSATLETTREILRQALRQAPVDADEAIESLLLDVPIAASLEPGEQERRREAAQSRHENYRKVLDFQRVTPLRALFEIQDAIRILNGNPNDAEKQLTRIEESSRELLVVDVPKSIVLTGAAEDNLLGCQPKDLADLIDKLRRTTARKNANVQEIQKLTTQLLAAINPQVKIALAGIVYAIYLEPDDLPVSSDPLLLRKHQFVKLDSSLSLQVPFCRADLLSDRTAGKYFLGGFSDFSAIAGRVAFTNARRADDKIEPYFVSGIGSIRASRWEELQDQDLRLAGLKITCAREWIVEAAGRPDLLTDLAESTSGLLSFARRASLLLGLQARDWKAVWESVTQGDLYHLGDEYLHRYSTAPWNSPVVATLRQFSATENESRMQILGADLQHILNCSHPHLTRLAPYENYERYLLLEKIAERTSEFKIYLAAFFDRLGMPASLLGKLAEPLAREVFRAAQLADLRDWSSVIHAYSSLNMEMIARANREHK